MAEWSDGYTSDIGYTFGCYPEMSPSYIYWALLCAGMRPSFDPRRVSYCELGFGHGVSLITNAAGSPNGQFWGTDFMPSQAAGAVELARAGGLSNVHLYDDSFAAFAERDLPKFDIIALHGVFSWVNTENQAVLIDFMRKNLAVGGVVYISYNTLPGWAALMPLRRLFAGRLLGDSNVARRLEQGLWVARRLKEDNAGYFQVNPGAVTHLAGLDSHVNNYLVHEYLNEQWQPLYHADVARMLERAKLEFATQVHPAEQMDRLTIPGSAADLLGEAVGAVERETLRDYFTNTRFRRDLFVRGRIGLREAEMIKKMREMRFALLTPPTEVSTTARIPGAELALDATLYEPILGMLCEGPQTLDAMAGRIDAPFDTLVEAMVILTSIHHVAPCLPVDGESERAASAKGLNDHLLARSEFGGGIGFLSSPVTGAGVAVPRLYQVFQLAVERDADPVEFAVEALTAAGETFQGEDGPLSAEERNQEMQRRFTAFRQAPRALLRGLGL